MKIIKQTSTKAASKGIRARAIVIREREIYTTGQAQTQFVVHDRFGDAQDEIGIDFGNGFYTDDRAQADANFEKRCQENGLDTALNVEEAQEHAQLNPDDIIAFQPQCQEAPEEGILYDDEEDCFSVFFKDQEGDWLNNGENLDGQDIIDNDEEQADKYERRTTAFAKPFIDVVKNATWVKTQTEHDIKGLTKGGSHFSIDLGSESTPVILRVSGNEVENAFLTKDWHNKLYELAEQRDQELNDAPETDDDEEEADDQVDTVYAQNNFELRKHKDGSTVPVALGDPIGTRDKDGNMTLNTGVFFASDEQEANNKPAAPEPRTAEQEKKDSAELLHVLHEVYTHTETAQRIMTSTGDALATRISTTRITTMLGLVLDMIDDEQQTVSDDAGEDEAAQDDRDDKEAADYTQGFEEGLAAGREEAHIADRAKAVAAQEKKDRNHAYTQGHKSGDNNTKNEAHRFTTVEERDAYEEGRKDSKANS